MYYRNVLIFLLYDAQNLKKCRCVRYCIVFEKYVKYRFIDVLEKYTWLNRITNYLQEGKFVKLG